MAKRGSGEHSVGRWQPVYNHRRKVIGHVRRVSGAFDVDQQWEVKGCGGVTFEDIFDAQKWLAEQQGVRYQVKTELSHRYWDGTQMGEAMDRDSGRVYAREHDADKLARQFDTGKSWDRVCVALWTKDNFGAKR